MKDIVKYMIFIKTEELARHYGDYYWGVAIEGKENAEQMMKSIKEKGIWHNSPIVEVDMKEGYK